MPDWPLGLIALLEKLHVCPVSLAKKTVQFWSSRALQRPSKTLFFGRFFKVFQRFAKCFECFSMILTHFQAQDLQNDSKPHLEASFIAFTTTFPDMMRCVSEVISLDSESAPRFTQHQGKIRKVGRG